jgi:hypothetical protein
MKAAKRQRRNGISGGNVISVENRKWRRNGVMKMKWRQREIMRNISVITKKNIEIAAAAA